MEHQDWKEVTISKPKVEKKTTSITFTSAPLKYDEDNQEIINLTSMDNKQSYIMMREALNLTRAQVALLMSVKVSIINDIENGNIIDKNLAGRYKNMLKMKMKKMNV